MDDELQGKLLWCSRLKKGIKLGKSQDNLSIAYLKKAQLSLKSMQLNYQAEIYDWAMDAAYYARYHAVYALFQKCGITCEIHDCSLMLLRFLFATQLDDTLFTEIEKAKEQRIKLVYYTDKLVPKEEIEQNINSAANFVLTIEQFISSLTAQTIIEINTKWKALLDTPEKEDNKEPEKRKY